MTETRYYSSTASLRELLASPDIAQREKESIRLEIAHREAACLPIDPAALKSLRESLCTAQTALGPARTPDNVFDGFMTPERRASAHIGQLIAIIDLHRPLGDDGKHGDLHTATCGCDDKPKTPCTVNHTTLGISACPSCGHDPLAEA